MNAERFLPLPMGEGRGEGLWRFTALAALALLSCAAAAWSAEPARSPTVHFHSGDFATGRLLDSPEAGVIAWQADAFALPLQLPLAGIHSLQFPTPQRPAEGGGGPYSFELAGGDTLSGGLVSLDAKQAVLMIPGRGELHVDRAQLLRFHRTSAADLIFAGPTGLQGWRQTVIGQQDEASDAWSEEAGQLRTSLPGARIHQHFRPPPLVRYEFELGWQNKPSFELTVGLNENADRWAFRIETWGDDLVVTREQANRADLALLQKIGEGEGRLRLLALYDQPQGRLLVYSSAGEKLADFSVPEEKSTAPPKVTRANPGLLLRAPSNTPQLPGGVQLINRKGDIKLQRLVISRWSGIAPSPAVAGQASIHQTDGTVRSAEVRSLDAASRELVIVRDGAEQRLPERALLDVVLSQPVEVDPRDVRVLLASGARLSGELTKVERDRLTLASPGIAEPLVLPIEDVQAVLVLNAPPPTVPEPLLSAEPPAPGEEPLPNLRNIRLAAAGTSLRGRLVDAKAGEHSCLVFHPRGSRTASPLAADLAGLIFMGEAPSPPKVEPPPPQQSPALQIVNGMRTLLGVRQTPGTTGLRPAPPGDCLLHLRSGDTLPCRVQFIDESGVTFQSTVTDAGFVPHEKIKALELRPEAPAVKIERTKFERLLTLPRMQRDNPPEQLIRSLEGDYLRGRLLAMNDKELQIEMRLETRTIDRAQVTRILWLHPDEAAKATVAKQEDPGTGKLPPGTRVQAVPKSGNRLTFFAQEFSGKTLSGHSEVLGACRVELDKIDQLLIGDAIEAAAATLAFHQWKLRPAAEPLPDPEPGADPSGSAGMESVLVGKDAPPIDLEMLGGKRFRLSDCKGKVVVLDFWASWCGPCLQAMPQVDSVAREFAEQGVQLVAINLEETPERIKAALERLKLETPVALDREGRAAERYGATAIPQTVIVDREGKVARLFIGGGARFDEQLRTALRAVLGLATTPGSPQ